MRTNLLPKLLLNFVSNARSTSGGDADEFYELVIRKINEETKWSCLKNWRMSIQRCPLFIQPTQNLYSHESKSERN